MYDWLTLLIIYIDKMVSWDWDVKEIRTKRMKIVIQEAAVLAKRKGTEQLTVPDQGSGEESARKVLEFLEEIREEKMRKDKEEQAKIKCNVSAGVFRPREEKEEKNVAYITNEATDRQDKSLISLIST